ncbi:MAG: phosphoribosyl-ATP diphosphatase [Spirochaetaceae bacterium]|jgi:phosphoribosyl-ATP pyrophosphohydrolase/phosphoribosyl-AMP cyclohydrolase|nr:phosphoribosyl-ATP diphosphatase [Spirochaetaceae bacterium]
MVIASIDIQNGKVVQLKQGSELMLQRENAAELAEEFNRYGEVCIIDLDAAMNKGGNIEMIIPLLRKADCRVGGGIRTAERARELISLGARKVIIGSVAFRDTRKKGAGMAAGEFAVNLPLLESLAKKVGRDRLIIAADARRGAGGNYEIVVDGWQTPTGLDLVDAARAVEPFVSELLFTCVDREGTMTGIDMEPVRQLREAVSCGVTVAGGVSTPEEVEAIAGLGCDVQLGMALYTGKLSLADAFVRSLTWKKGCPPLSPSAPVPHPLLPVIAQSPDGQVLMTGFTDREALTQTFARGNLCFYSRGRDRLWMKGESSGNTLRLLSLRADCDRDALLAVAEPAGSVCHTGARTCFSTERRYTWQFLQGIIADRFKNPSPGSYTATLDDELVREKVREEAGELCTAATHDEIVWEAADLLYFMTALMTRSGVTVEEVLGELDRRHKK